MFNLLKLSKEEKNKIEENWKILKQKRKGLFNGTLLRVLGFEMKNDNFILKTMADIKYKNLVGLRSEKLKLKIMHKNIFQVLSCNIFIETFDNKKFFIARDAGDWRKSLDFVGGFIQEKHNIKNVENFVESRILEDLGLEKKFIKEMEFLGFYDAKEILELMLLYKVKINITLQRLQEISKVKIFEIPKNYSLQNHKTFFKLPIHLPIKKVLEKW